MFGIPLHPLVVHFPIVLAMLLPISVVVALWVVGKALHRVGHGPYPSRWRQR